MTDQPQASPPKREPRMPEALPDSVPKARETVPDDPRSTPRDDGLEQGRGNRDPVETPDSLPPAHEARRADG